EDRDRVVVHRHRPLLEPPPDGLGVRRLELVARRAQVVEVDVDLGRARAELDRVRLGGDRRRFVDLVIRLAVHPDPQPQQASDEDDGPPDGDPDEDPLPPGLGLALLPHRLGRPPALRLPHADQHLSQTYGRFPRRTRVRSAAMSRLHSVRLGWLSFAAAALGVLWAAPAFAHALATGTEPASGDILDTPPDEVVVEFNEPVTPVDAATGVVAPDGDRVDTGIVETDDAAALVIGVDADQEGTYLVGYRVVSADGHPISGTFTFAVGHETEAPAAEALISETDPLVQGLLYAARAAGYAGLALALGAGLLLALGAGPRALLARLVAIGLSAVAAAAIAGIVLQAAYESGVSISGLDPVALQAVMASNFGLAALLRLLLVLLALPLMRSLVAVGSADRLVN